MCLRVSSYVLKEVSFTYFLKRRKMSWNYFCIKLSLRPSKSIRFLRLYCNFLDFVLDWFARHILLDMPIFLVGFAYAQSHWGREYDWIIKNLQVYLVLSCWYFQSTWYWSRRSWHSTWNWVDHSKRNMIVARTWTFPLLSFSKMIQTAIMFIFLHLTTFRNIIKTSYNIQIIWVTATNCRRVIRTARNNFRSFSKIIMITLCWSVARQTGKSTSEKP